MAGSEKSAAGKPRPGRAAGAGGAAGASARAGSTGRGSRGKAGFKGRAGSPGEADFKGRAGSPGEAGRAGPDRRRPGRGPKIVDPLGNDTTDRGWRPERTALAFGVGLAATGVGAVIGLAAERMASSRGLPGLPGLAGPSGPDRRGGQNGNGSGEGARVGPEPEAVGDPDASTPSIWSRATARTRLARHTGPATTDGRGGPELGALRGDPRLVMSGDVPLHVEVDEYDPAWADDPAVNRLTDGDVPTPRTGGRKPPLTVVLTHGYSLSLDAWHYQRLALRGHCRLVLWDQRGHGRSGTGRPGSSTIDQIGHDLAAVIDEVAPDGPLVLLGHSMGGMTVMALAEQRPGLFAERVVGVGLFCTSAGGLGALDLGLSGLGRALMTVAPTAARLLARQPGLVAHGRRLGSDLESILVRRYSFASPVPSELARFSSGLIARTRMEVISDFLPGLGAHDKRAALAVLDGHELLVMAGEDDMLIPRAHSDEIVAGLSDVEYVVVRDAGHLLPLEYPELVNTYLLELLSDAAATARDRRPSRRRGWGRRTVTPVRDRRDGHHRAPGERGGGHR
ncbi:alpha/beta fold hydrolase [Kineosporia succinea]|uniref:Pimeloyl-ACP methyl ester carboxylesterase n=1 Tax=Kineosporia succinea TaxID=84632 RepID=A0ABT9P3I0_9ACTN|nr:alpha/beta fold hydrolase [Kineosporia succinea]MDP9827227.1 pimeloyl-ACP methyl ester carboxylesterase [Kineosporia succinea]